MNPEAAAGTRRTRKRTWFLLGLGGVILCAVVWSALGGPGVGASPLPQPPPIPDPNGYDDVLEAGRAIEQAGTMAPRLDLAKADETVLAADRRSQPRRNRSSAEGAGQGVSGAGGLSHGLHDRSPDARRELDPKRSRPRLDCRRAAGRFTGTHR